MPALPANGLVIEYDTFGTRGDEPMVLIMGLGTQMIAWPEPFCELLAGHGFFVVRHDNRDCGLSSQVEGGPTPDLLKAMSGDLSSASYSLLDMAKDTLGLMDGLGIDRAHVVGASMGGFIAQEMAINFPGRVGSLASIMSSTGNLQVGAATPEALGTMLAPPPATRAEAIDRGVAVSRVIGSRSYPFGEAQLRADVERAHDRGYWPLGTARQMLATAVSGDRTAKLASVIAPTVVIHGGDDPLITISGGEATAKAIPNAKFVTIPGMAHDLPEFAWPVIVDAIVENARRAT